MIDNVTRLQPLKDNTEYEKAKYALTNGHKLDIFTACLDFGITNLPKAIEELLQNKWRIVYKTKIVDTKFAGLIEVEEYYLKSKVRKQ